MRLIKFMAWDGKQMMEWGFYKDRFFGPPSTTKSCLSMIQLQFTGLHDKNGKEIWEGDVVEFTDDAGDDGIMTLRGEVYYEGCAFHVRGQLKFQDLLTTVLEMECEVLGNIYENPELSALEGGGG